MSANRNVRISAPETRGEGSPGIVSSVTTRRVYDHAHLLACPEARREPTIMPAPKRELERTRLQRERGPTHPTLPRFDGKAVRTLPRGTKRNAALGVGRWEGVTRGWWSLRAL